MRLRVEDKHMGRVGAFNGSKADPFVKASRIGVVSAQAYTTEVGACLLDESGHECSANAFVPPRMPYVNLPDSAYFRAAGKGIDVKTSYGNQQALVQMATQGLSRSIEAVLCAGPLLHQGFDEAVALGKRLRLQALQSREGQLNFLDRDHCLNDKDTGCFGIRRA